MTYQTYMGNELVLRLANWGATELLPAVCEGPETKLARTESLASLPWTGDTPSLVSGTGKIYRLGGVGEYVASMPQVRDWHELEGYNLLLQHRFLRGLRLEGKTVGEAHQRWLKLHAECEDFLSAPFTPPVFLCPGTPGKPPAATMVVEVSSAWIDTLVAPGAALLGANSFSLVSGTNHTGKPILMLDSPSTWGPPRITELYLRALWQETTGQRVSEKTAGDAAMRRIGILATDPLARLLDRNGWVLGANPRGLALRCPYHPRAHTPALYEPAWDGRRKPRITCPHCPRSQKLGDYLAMMGLADEAASI